MCSFPDFTNQEEVKMSEKDDFEVGSSFLTLPNAITSLRFLLIPVTVFSILEREFVRAAILVSASFATDVLDGFVARRWGQHSELGRIIDPVADKANNILVLTCLSWIGRFPYWALLLFVVRELVILGSGLILILQGQRVIPSLIYGRVAGFFFILTEVVYLLNIESLHNVSLVVFVFMMTLSLIKYLENYMRQTKKFRK
jgi:cardiolipin synthase